MAPKQRQLMTSGGDIVIPFVEWCALRDIARAASDLVVNSDHATVENMCDDAATVGYAPLNTLAGLLDTYALLDNRRGAAL